MKKFAFCLSVAIGFAAQLAPAQSYEFTVDAKASSSDRSIGVLVPFAGTWIGNYDAEANPEGTRTVPGAFGGSGNNPISYSASVDVDGSNQSSPVGSFSLDVDLPASLATMDGFTLDFLGGGTEEIDITLNLLYETFRTFSPFSLFPGGIEIPVPLGSAQITVLEFVQTESAELVLVEGESTTVAGLIPGELLFEVAVLGQEFGGTPVPSALPIAGTLIQNENGAQFTVSASTEFDEVLPAPELPIDDAPIELPTVLPPGGVASLLLSGDVGEGTLTGSFNLTVSADADNPSCPEDPDLNGDGVVNGTDLTILLGDWNAPGGPADINCDDIVDGTDLTLLLGSWNSG